MYEEEIHFVKLLLKEPETVLAQLTLDDVSWKVWAVMSSANST